MSGSFAKHVVVLSDRSLNIQGEEGKRVMEQELDEFTLAESVEAQGLLRDSKDRAAAGYAADCVLVRRVSSESSRLSIPCFTQGLTC